MSSVCQNELRSASKISSGLFHSRSAVSTDMFYFYWPDDSLDELVTMHNFLQQEEEYQLVVLCDAIAREYRARDQLAAFIDSKSSSSLQNDTDSDVEVIEVKQGNRQQRAMMLRMRRGDNATQSSALLRPPPHLIVNRLAQWRQAFEKEVNERFRGGNALLNRRLLQFHLELLKQLDRFPDTAAISSQHLVRIRNKYALCTDWEGRKLLVRRKSAAHRFVPREDWFDVLLELYRSCGGGKCSGAQYYKEVRRRFANLGKLIVQLFLRTAKIGKRMIEMKTF